MTSELNPRTQGYEFLGPPGALFVTTSVPFLTYALYFFCSEGAGGCPPSLWLAPTRLVDAITSPDFWFSLFELKPFLLYLAWYAYCVVAWAVLPGAWVAAPPMRNGERKHYKVNGKSLVS